MAFFGVTEEEIGSVAAIPGADRIEVATLRGKDFQFVIGRGAFRAGDRCLYIPVDALLPAPLAAALGVAGKLAGSEKNRVKTVKLRGQLSQGIVAPLDVAPAEVRARGTEALTAHLGVTKHEPAEVVCNDATLQELPDGVSVYDIEGADRYTEQAALLHEGDVLITEKVEGSNFSVMVRPDGETLVNQRTRTILPREGVEHTFWKIARERRALDFARSVAARHPGKTVLVYGEAIGPGIQGNLYGLRGHEVRFFDLRVGGAWLGADAFLREVEDFYGTTEGWVAPVLHRGPLGLWLAGRSIKEASDGPSKLAEVLREGIVIRPLEERTLAGFGRLILKQRSPTYLASSDR
ncbi:MAG: RNA ligase (ATP) [Polyangiaceae bacterium]|jgi:RNA ligase (TIGR02306 family)|nr:RNA ligase (ATP) [Polyangiaceae bacterium]